MKRTLLLMRHAKSAWDDPSLSDAKRPLNARGEKDAPEMGRRLAEAGYRCDRLLSSPAVRARETAKAVASALSFSEKITVSDALYMADIEEYLQVIGKVDDTVEHLMIVSHNPGTEEFVAFLTGARMEKFPTAAYALIEVKGSWSDLSRGKLLRFDFPKSR
jgi:phosphohistidine phosphatase